MGCGDREWGGQGQGRTRIRDVDHMEHGGVADELIAGDEQDRSVGLHVLVLEVRELQDADRDRESTADVVDTQTLRGRDVQQRPVDRGTCCCDVGDVRHELHVVGRERASRDPWRRDPRRGGNGRRDRHVHQERSNERRASARHRQATRMRQAPNSGCGALSAGRPASLGSDTVADAVEPLNFSTSIPRPTSMM